MTHRGFVFLLMLGLAGCGGRASGANVAPVPTPEGVVGAFLSAVADSNVVKMAHYWGGSKGPAAVTGQPDQYRKRIEVMQIFLRHSAYHILGVHESADPNTRRVDVELTRDNCVRSVPFRVSRWSKGGWVIVAIDLTAATGPDAACIRPAGG